MNQEDQMHESDSQETPWHTALYQHGVSAGCPCRVRETNQHEAINAKPNRMPHAKVANHQTALRCQGTPKMRLHAHINRLRREMRDERPTYQYQSLRLMRLGNPTQTQNASCRGDNLPPMSAARHSLTKREPNRELGVVCCQFSRAYAITPKRGSSASRRLWRPAWNLDVTGVYAAATLFGAKISFLRAPIASSLF